MSVENNFSSQRRKGKGFSLCTSFVLLNKVRRTNLFVQQSCPHRSLSFKVTHDRKGLSEDASKKGVWMIRDSIFRWSQRWANTRSPLPWDFFTSLWLESSIELIPKSACKTIVKYAHEHMLFSLFMAQRMMSSSRAEYSMVTDNLSHFTVIQCWCSHCCLAVSNFLLSNTILQFTI